MDTHPIDKLKKHAHFLISPKSGWTSAPPPPQRSAAPALLKSCITLFQNNQISELHVTIYVRYFG